ncbi:MAG TPA: hypothetical protein ENI66_00135 [Candidatus Yonathbacteria bacterium]|nr:hypothetical protein [Candidatus Yonathbacteria bacterium]
MGNRKEPLITGEYYHIYNRGVDKRTVFEDKHELYRFMESIREFNTREPIGSLYENSFNQLGGSTPKSIYKSEKLVDFIAYCLNHNHYHFLLKQKIDGGISEFMKRLNGGYTVHFNDKHDRSGALFQGRFKSIHVDSNEYLLYLSAYINKNYEVHQLGGSTPKLVESWSSWGEYTGGLPKEKNICEKNIILEQFENVKIYERFVNDVVNNVVERRQKEKEIDYLLIE